MKLIYNKIFLEHNNEGHPENSSRLKYFQDYPDTNIEDGEEYLGLAHSKEYIKKIKEASKKEEWLDGDTYTNKNSFKVACCAVGATIMAAKQGGFALVRPPGHHAGLRPMGFCLFNNIAIAAKYLINKGKRVFIIDFDIHHGNGTQELLINNKDIIYFSTHQHGYPGTGLTNESNCINILFHMGTEDKEYIKILKEKLAPKLKEFKPDVIGVSAGFDSYYKDFMYMNPGIGFKLTKKSYLFIKEVLQDYNHFFVLEGGYNPESIKEGVGVFENKPF